MEDYTFYLGFCMIYGALTSLQLTGVVTGLTLGEFKDANCPNGEPWWSIALTKHKTGWKKAADLCLPDWGYQKLLRYKKIFRPSSSALKQNSHFFNQENGKNCVQKSALSANFRKCEVCRGSLTPTICTQSLHATAPQSAALCTQRK